MAIVPARNEADVVGPCVTSLLGQCDVDLQVVLVDDSSTDGTAEIARRAAAGNQAHRLTVITGRPLPPGWSGKLWAVAQGVQQARAMLNDPRVPHPFDRLRAGSRPVLAKVGESRLDDAGHPAPFENPPDFLLLTDADVRHAPESVSQLAAIAEAERADVVSFMVRLRCRSLPERLLTPAFVFFFFMLYPPRWIADPRRQVAGAAGGSILVRPEALQRAGGIEAIRGEIIDDCALARAVKHSGGRVWLGLTDSAEQLRGYRSFGEIGRMIARTAFNQLHHSTALLIASLAGLVLTYVLPIAALFSGNLTAAVLGGMAWLAMSLAYAPMVRFYRLNLLWTLTLPAAAGFYMGATILSAVDYWTGRGGQWKGRAQDI